MRTRKLSAVLLAVCGVGTTAQAWAGADRPPRPGSPPSASVPSPAGWTAEVVVTYRDAAGHPVKPPRRFRVEDPDAVARLSDQFPGITGGRGKGTRTGGGGWRAQVTVLFRTAGGGEGELRVAHVSPDFSEWVWRDNTATNFPRAVADAAALRGLIQKLAAGRHVELD